MLDCCSAATTFYTQRFASYVAPIWVALEQLQQKTSSSSCTNWCNCKATDRRWWAQQQWHLCKQKTRLCSSSLKKCAIERLRCLACCIFLLGWSNQCLIGWLPELLLEHSADIHLPSPCSLMQTRHVKLCQSRLRDYRQSSLTCKS